MPIPRNGLRVTERQFQTAVIEMAQFCGWKVAHFRPARTADGGWRTPVEADGKGFPDLFLARPLDHPRGGGIIAAELKVGDQRVTKEQQAWLDRLAGSGVRVYVWNPFDMIQGRITEALQ